MSNNGSKQLPLAPMSKEQAAYLTNLLIGSFPSLNAHEPEIFAARLTETMARYPYWAGERVVASLPLSTDWPTVKALREALEGQVAMPRYGAQWDKGAAETVQGRLSAPPRPTYDELRSKHGENWGIAQETKPPAFASLEQLRERFGSKLDDVPDAPLRNWDQGKAAARVAADLAQRRQGREQHGG